MLNFICVNCKSEIQAEYSSTGDVVACPVCEIALIVPSHALSQGEDFHGYVIDNVQASNLLWTVYLARNKESNDKILLKIPTAFFIKHISDYNSFSNLVIKSGTLNIKGFLTLSDYSLKAGQYYFAFEALEKQLDTFEYAKALVKGGGWRTALNFIHSIAVSLSKAHDKSLLIHQNLNPENLKIANQKIYIDDFGLSAFLLEEELLIRNGFNIWDFKYVDQEVLEVNDADSPSIDIYSLGKIFYLFLTGRHFSDEQILLLSSEKIRELIDRKIPDDVAALCYNLLAGINTSSWPSTLGQLETVCEQYPINEMPDTVLPMTLPKDTVVNPMGITAGRLPVIHKDKKLETVTGVSESQVVKAVDYKKITPVKKKWKISKKRRSSAKTSSNTFAYIVVFFIIFFITASGLLFLFRDDLSQFSLKMKINNIKSQVSGNESENIECEEKVSSINSTKEKVDKKKDDAVVQKKKTRVLKPFSERDYLNSLRDNDVSARPKPDAYAFSDNIKRKYLKSLNADLRECEALKLEQLSGIKHYLCLLMERSPYEGIAVMLKNGNCLAFSSLMANHLYISVKRSDTGKRERVLWSDVSLQQMVLFLEYFAKKRQEADVANGMSVKAKKKEVAWDYLRIAVLCDWFGDCKGAVKYAKKAINVDPNINKDVCKYLILPQK